MNSILLQVAIITPFNFPLEIPLLQLMGALYMGNKPVLKVDSKVNFLCGKCFTYLLVFFLSIAINCVKADVFPEV